MDNLVLNILLAGVVGTVYREVCFVRLGTQHVQFDLSSFQPNSQERPDTQLHSSIRMRAWWIWRTGAIYRMDLSVALNSWTILRYHFTLIYS